MDDAKLSGDAAQVILLIREAIEAIVDRAAVEHLNPHGRPVPLLFPHGIADVHISFSIKGGASIDVEISGSPAHNEIREVIEEKFPRYSRASAHPMTVKRHNDEDTNPVYVTVSPYPSVAVPNDGGSHEI